MTGGARPYWYARSREYPRAVPLAVSWQGHLIDFALRMGPVLLVLAFVRQLWGAWLVLALLAVPVILCWWLETRIARWTCDPDRPWEAYQQDFYDRIGARWNAVKTTVGRANERRRNMEE